MSNETEGKNYPTPNYYFDLSGSSIVYIYK